MSSEFKKLSHSIYQCNSTMPVKVVKRILKVVGLLRPRRESAARKRCSRRHLKRLKRKSRES